jgi:hypothetical protein
MSDSAASGSLTGWQRTHVLAAAEYIREILFRTPGDTKARAVYDGLLDLLEPSRRAARPGADTSTKDGEFEIRAEKDRRSGVERRRAAHGPPAGIERRQRERRRAERRRR